MSSTAIRVAVIDDHQVFADALASRLGEESDLTVVGTARTATDSWELLKRHPVDVIALDLARSSPPGPTSASWW
jgi:DNA-binding NarL/FixJ family response regulator